MLNGSKDRRADKFCRKVASRLDSVISHAHLLLLFMYTEGLGMIGIFFVSKRIPITLPIFIAITAITRLIILQGKDMDMISLMYEASAILILALAILAVRFRPKNHYSYQTDD